MTAIAGTHRDRPDPVWRRRALLVALLIIGLAGPVWLRQAPPEIRIWFDDGPSLFSREADGTTRLDAAAAVLSGALADTDAERVTLHAFSRPSETHRLERPEAVAIQAALRTWLTGPGADSGAGPESLPTPPPGVRRWLVSDGGRQLEPRAFAFHRTFAIGRNTENSALVRLAVRPSLRQPEQLLGLVSVLHAGHEPTRTRVALSLDGRILQQWALDLSPGERITRGFELDAAIGGTLSARLRPDSDALPTDDELQLDIGAAARGLPLTVTGDCRPSVNAAIAAHPGLYSAPEPNAGLRLWCSPEPPPAQGPPVLWLMPGLAGPPPSEPPVWSIPAASEPPRLNAAWILPIAATDAPGERPLLRAGEQTLISETAEGQQIRVLFDPDATALSARPELPLLIALLLDRLAGSDLLLPAAAAFRDPALVPVAPRPLAHHSAAFTEASAPLDAAPLLIAAALALLLFDLYRQQQADGRT